MTVADDLAALRWKNGEDAALDRLEAEIARLTECAQFAGVPAWTKLWLRMEDAEAEVVRLAEARAVDTTMYLAQNGELMAEVVRLRDGLQRLRDHHERSWDGNGHEHPVGVPCRLVHDTNRLLVKDGAT